MVEVSFAKGPYGYEKMKLTGHANYNPGNDVVCAGISALSQALVGTLKNIKGISFRKLVVDSGNIDLEVDPMFDDKVQSAINGIFTTVLIGLLQIEQSYPDHINILSLG